MYVYFTNSAFIFNPFVIVWATTINGTVLRYFLTELDYETLKNMITEETLMDQFIFLSLFFFVSTHEKNTKSFL